MSTLKVAIVQYDIQWQEKETNLNTLEMMIGKHFAENQSVDLLVLPETFSTGFCVDDEAVKQPADGGEDLKWMKRVSVQHNCIVAGSVFVDHESKKANRFYWVSPDGSVKYYDKRHLFRLGNEGDFVAQGEDRKVFEINGVRILPQVCYDLRFPVFARNRQDYDVMVNVANWPAVRRHVWDTLLKARAMENQAFVIGVNRVGSDGKGMAHSGGSCVLDFIGETMVCAKDDQQQVISAELDISKLEKFKQSFPAYLDADRFELSL